VFGLRKVQIFPNGGSFSMKALSELCAGDEVAIIAQGCLGQSAKIAKVKTVMPEFIEVEIGRWVVKFPLEGSLVRGTSEEWLSRDRALIARIKADVGLRRILKLSAGEGYTPPSCHRSAQATQMNNAPTLFDRYL
jgi:hypothetical protein